MRIVKTITFDAAHYLHVDTDKRPYARLHGHSFMLEIAIEGEPDPETGWVEDFADVTASLEEIRSVLDHRLLNEIEGLEKPTLENICRFVADRLKTKFSGLRQVKVSRPSIGEACIYDVA
ncbi:MAG TPA: 6-carboxytetrahydropterin synthase QueD [Parvularculaceae bacterium]|jgi:6-pyruvoyltetrahydropterin/6-carboxytetrahydropterin synthase|nr:6-carboxytetrahydropterin synthase QueD [Caulobacterales bacterium]HOP19664.1 6-carboxytetrahydropterin synthase QueD [Amphiplicatus sp.]HPE31081.1 6-carboxytetrahydropterin synthase QueD [Parvularculaceae bacterium]HRX37946.1 6-carboxytetrahydropterin synthase QueD [Parvularculaceae bacterium]